MSHRWPATALTLALVAGCAGGDAPDHLPHPLWLPAAAVGHALQEAPYRARRATLARFVSTQQPALCADLAAGGGPTLNRAMRLARIPAADQASVGARLCADAALCSGPPEPLIVALMVHGR